MGTFHELTLEPLKATQYESACIPQVVVGINESRAPSPMNPTGISQLRRCGRLGLEEQVGALLALASGEGRGSLISQCLLFFVVNIPEIFAWVVFPDVPECLLMSSELLSYHFPLCDTVQLKGIFLNHEDANTS